MKGIYIYIYICIYIYLGVEAACGAIAKKKTKEHKYF